MPPSEATHTLDESRCDIADAARSGWARTFEWFGPHLKRA